MIPESLAYLQSTQIPADRRRGRCAHSRKSPATVPNQVVAMIDDNKRIILLMMID